MHYTWAPLPPPFQDEKPAQHGGLQKSQKQKKEVVLQLRRQPSGEATAMKRYASSHREKQSPLTLSLSPFFFAALCSMQDLSFPTRDQTCAPCSGSTES